MMIAIDSDYLRGPDELLSVGRVVATLDAGASSSLARQEVTRNANNLYNAPNCDKNFLFEAGLSKRSTVGRHHIAAFFRHRFRHQESTEMTTRRRCAF